MLIAKPKTFRSMAFINWVRGLNCMKCGNPPRNQAAHVSLGNDKGMAHKVGDNNAVPLCVGCHAEQHRIGERRFWGDIDRVHECSKDIFSIYPKTSEANWRLDEYRIGF